jgi:Ferritin-like
LVENMTPHRITTVEQLHKYLHAAMQLEHGTIPPYLTALYSLHPGSNSDALHIMRAVVVEEMLHLTLVANVMNAVGGTPDLTQPDFVPSYPACLPDGETDFEVDLQPFSREAVATFMKIERPAMAPDEGSRLLPRGRPRQRLLAASPEEPAMQFYSIGEFYQEIARGLRYLHQQCQEDGGQLFAGDPSRQVTSEYFYSGGGELIPVADLDSALAAVRLIGEQGEGYGGGIYDAEKELAHYYRYQQLQLGRYYQAGDRPGQATGPPLDIDWDAVYPVLRNARLEDYPEGSELHAAARKFNETYADFLGFLTRAYTGHPEFLLEAVWRMFLIRDDMNRLIHNPVPERDGVHGAPTFELANLIRGPGS